MKSSKMSKVVDFIIGKSEISIKSRIYRVILFICVTLILFFGFVAFVGIYNSKDFAVEISSSIGDEALEKSSDILREKMQEDLLYHIEERTRRIQDELYYFYADVRMLKTELDEIHQHPEFFRPRPVRLGRDFMEGDVAAVRYAPFVNVEDLTRDPLKSEIETLGTLQDWFYFLSLKYHNPDFWDAPTFGILSESGVGVMADSAVTLEQWRTSNDNADFWSSPLYRETKKAWQEGKRDEDPIFTSTYSTGINKNMGVFSCSLPYDINGEFAGVVFFSILIEELDYLVEPASETNNSINFILSDDGRVLLSSNKTDLKELNDIKVVYDNPPDIRQSQQSEISDFAKKMTEGKKAIEEISINGNQYYIAYAPIEGLKWSLGVLLPANEVTEVVQENKNIIKNLTDEKVKTLDQRFLTVIFLMIGFAILLWAVVTAIGRKLAGEFVKPIQELSDGVRDIAAGNLDKQIEINTKDEIAHLAICFNMMTNELKNYMENLKNVTAEKERIATELNVAKDIQLGILPKDFNFNRKDFEIYATMNAAKEVGGDFYDFYLLDEDHLVMTVADVSGKGIPAALFMMISKTILKNFATFTTTPDDFSAVVACANDQLCQNNEEMMFVTVFFGVLEISTGKFVFVNGGHNPPVIYHKKENSCEFLSVKKNFVLGGMDGVPFVQQEIYFEEGDLIFAYTDGVNEAMNIDHEEYTSEKLLNFMNSTDLNDDLKNILKKIRADVAEHVGAAEQSDDITMMALRFNGKK